MSSERHGVRPVPDQSASTARERIIDAAVRCFAQRGVEDTTLVEVAREAGVHRVTVHRVFPGGRDELIVEVIEHSAERIMGLVRHAVSSASSVSDAAVDGAVVGVVEARHDPVLLGAIRSTEAQQVVLSSRGTPLHAIVADLWRLVVERAGETEAEVVVEADQVLLVNHWIRVLVSLAVNPEGVETPAKLRRYLRAFVVPALVRPVQGHATHAPQM